jgi:hypothetical protein
MLLFSIPPYPTSIMIIGTKSRLTCCLSHTHININIPATQTESTMGFVDGSTVNPNSEASESKVTLLLQYLPNC